MFFRGESMHGFIRGEWFFLWEVCGFFEEACMVFWGCMVFSGGWHAWFFWGVCMVAGGSVHGCQGACIGYDEIRSMSGRYASYWNAFLFGI